MRLPDDPDKYTSSFKYIEIGRWRYIEKAKKFQISREVKSTGHNSYETKRFPIEYLTDYARKYNWDGIYTSIFQYNSEDIDNSTSLGPVYFDIDSGELEVSLAEANSLVDHLLRYLPDSAVRCYFTGQKGFHIECEPIAVGITPHDELSGIFRFIAEDLHEKLDLQSLDYSVYDRRRMWRAPNSRHQRTGLYKVECMPLRKDPRGIEAILEYAKEPHLIDTPEQSFVPEANRWYREYVYAFEQSKLDKRDYNISMLDRFLTDGSDDLYEFTGEREFDVVKLRHNCSAFRELEKKAHDQHFLTHYERLFLCSLLSYTDEAVMFFLQLLSKLDDYNFEISNAHIEDWIKRREYDIGGRPFTCRKAKEVGIMCADCDKMEPHTKKIQVGNKWVSTGEESDPSPIRHAYSYRRK